MTSFDFKHRMDILILLLNRCYKIFTAFIKRIKTAIPFSNAFPLEARYHHRKETE